METAIAVGVALLVSLAAPALLKPLLSRLGVIDVPNARSSHTVSVLRGVGLAPLVAILLGMLIVLFDPAVHEDAPLVVSILVVSVTAGLLGWVEDSRGIPVAVRAGVQIAVGAAGAAALAVITGMPLWLAPLLAIAIAGYINVANFMDGINGISGLHGAASGVAYALIGAIAGESWMIPVGLVIAVAFLGFLPWNLIRGGMFLGDVGSYLLGGSLAMVAAAAIASGVSIVGAIGPLIIYLADAGVTLVRRVLRGERWYEAHRSHVYQRLTDAGLSHLQVAAIVSAFGIASSAAGFIAVATPTLWPLSALLLLIIVVIYFMLGRIVNALRGRHIDEVSGDRKV